jgi:hypothetical protein
VGTEGNERERERARGTSRLLNPEPAVCEAKVEIIQMRTTSERLSLQIG